MSNITEVVAQDILRLKPFNDIDTVNISDWNDYPCIGIGGWNLEDADQILEQLPNTEKFVDTPYAMLSKSAIKQLKNILRSQLSQRIQLKKLHLDLSNYLTIINKYVTDYQIVRYLLIWCSYKSDDILQIIRTTPSYQLQSLENVHRIFISSTKLIGLEDKCELIYQYLTTD